MHKDFVAVEEFGGAILAELLVRGRKKVEEVGTGNTVESSIILALDAEHVSLALGEGKGA